MLQIYLPTHKELKSMGLVYLPKMKCTRLNCCFCHIILLRLGEHVLTLIDVETRYKEAELLTSKDSKEVVKAFEKIYTIQVNYKLTLVESLWVL